ncbi:MAG TPA: cytochrome c oxidase subunit II [Blastocatellia bacterium]|nr:cytochrome c oxidase subunit II [Blastocatellia bacterium]
MKTATKQLRPGRCLALVCAASVLLCSGCAGVQSALDPAGLQAHRISRLWWLMFWVCLSVFVIVMGALGYALWRSRRRERVATEPEAERSMTRWVTGAVVVSAAILFILLIADFSTGRAITSLESSDAVMIKVTGHQWWWEFTYDDPVPSQQVTTANEIHIPVGRPVRLEMTSHDVIHSFWVPNLHGKTDLLVGHQTVTWLQADRPGTYRGQCAEYCGHQHAHMALLVVAEPPEDFKAWLDHERLPAADPSNDEQRRGRQIFLTRAWVMCHQIRGTDAGARSGPDLTHLASRQTIAAGTLPNNRGNLGGWVVDSQGIKPGNKMPPNELSGEELQALLSYLESLK